MVYVEPGDTNHEDALDDTDHEDALDDTDHGAGLKGAARSRAAGPWSPARGDYLARAELRAPDIPRSDRERAGAFEVSLSAVVVVKALPTTGRAGGGFRGVVVGGFSRREDVTSDSPPPFAACDSVRGANLLPLDCVRSVMSEWKYDVDDVGEDAESGAESPSGDGPDRPELEPLEPGSPTAENALFVVLGVATMLFLFARVLTVVGG